MKRSSFIVTAASAAAIASSGRAGARPLGAVRSVEVRRPRRRASLPAGCSGMRPRRRWGGYSRGDLF
jgi:hypothetical protein